MAELSEADQNEPDYDGRGLLTYSGWKRVKREEWRIGMEIPKGFVRVTPQQAGPFTTLAHGHLMREALQSMLDFEPSKIAPEGADKQVADFCRRTAREVLKRVREG
jgi:hypothetical protein